MFMSAAPSAKPAIAMPVTGAAGVARVPSGAMLTHGASTRTYASWSEIVGLRHEDDRLLSTCAWVAARLD